MNRRRRIYEGKAKVLYEGPEPGTLIQHFKDDATAFNAKKHEVDRRQGRAQQPDLRVHLPAPERHRRAHPLHPPPQHARAADPRGRDHPARSRRAQRRRRLAVASASASRKARSCRARSSSSTTRTTRSTTRWSRKSTSPPSAGRRPQEIDDIMALAIRVNDFLSGLFLGVGIRLVDFKMECGRLWEGDMMRIVVADEISPDSCRLWDIKSERQARQGPLPPRHGRPGRSLSGSRPPPRHHERERAAGRGQGPASRSPTVQARGNEAA